MSGSHWAPLRQGQSLPQSSPHLPAGQAERVKKRKGKLAFLVHPGISFASVWSLIRSHPRRSFRRGGTRSPRAHFNFSGGREKRKGEDHRGVKKESQQHQPRKVVFFKLFLRLFQTFLGHTSQRNWPSHYTYYREDGRRHISLFLLLCMGPPSTGPLVFTYVVALLRT